MKCCLDKYIDVIKIQTIFCFLRLYLVVYDFCSYFVTLHCDV